MNPHASVIFVPILLVGCVGELGYDTDAQDQPFGGPFDVRQAESLWSEIDGHTAWPSFPGKEGIQPGSSPHGAYQTYHLNDVAAADPDGLDFGSIVIKRNFATADGIEPGAITVMKRVNNFNPDERDWFWAKFRADGSLDKNEAGVPLAGAVGKGGDAGCIGCHQNAPGDDFVFVNGPSLPFGTPQDLALAGTLWATIAGHTAWPPFDGREGVQMGNSPHGAFQTFHLNDVAVADQVGLPGGSIIIKRNQMSEDPSTLGAITVMQKIAGYNPDELDWFWVKFLPTGEVEKNADGVALAGAVGKGQASGCIPCHAGAPGSDFVFVNNGGNGP